MDFIIDWMQPKMTLRWTKGEPHRVVLIGDAREKVLYEGNSTLVATRTFHETKAHYEQRRAEEANAVVE